MNSSSSKKTNNTLDMVKMGKHIAELRKRKGYTQKKLGEILDISDKTISKWELGFIAPDITLINALAIALDVTIEEILKGESIPDEQKMVDNSKSDIEDDNYKNKRRNKFMILIIFIITAILFAFFIHNYNKWELIKIEGKDSEFYISGYILTNNRESKLIIDKILYTNNKAGVNVDEYFEYIKIEAFVGEMQIFSEINDLSNPKLPISKFLENHVIIEQKDFVIDNNLLITIERRKSNNDSKQRNIIKTN